MTKPLSWATRKAAVVQKMALIGEAAKQPRDRGFEERHPEVAWDKAAGLRNPNTHGCFSVDYSIVYRTVLDDLPVLKGRVQAILAAEPPGV